MLALLYLSLVLHTLTICTSKEIGLPIGARELEGLLDDDQVQFLFDFRKGISRETDGYIETSILVPETVGVEDAKGNVAFDKLIPAGDRKGLAVYVADDTVRAQESEAILSQLGFSNVRAYLAGMNEWDEAGGLIRYPKLITFPALKEQLEKKAITLIDVRNRTELNQYGRIEGSVNLPSHEIESALQLSEKEFEGKYGFPKPKTDDRKIALSCGSGFRAHASDERMQNYGYTFLRVYEGSFADWKQQGGKIVDAHIDVDYSD